jgi:hypothetical protein
MCVKILVPNITSYDARSFSESITNHSIAQCSSQPTMADGSPFNYIVFARIRKWLHIPERIPEHAISAISAAASPLASILTLPKREFNKRPRGRRPPGISVTQKYVAPDRLVSVHARQLQKQVSTIATVAASAGDEEFSRHFDLKV